MPLIEGGRDAQAASDRDDLAAFPTRAQVKAAIDELTGNLGILNTDINTLAGTPTNAQILVVLRHMAENQKDVMQNQRAIIRSLNVLVHRGQ